MGFIGDVVGAVIGAHASKKASEAQVASAHEAIGEEQRQYDLTRADFAPWRAAGGAAITNGAAMLQPGYDYTTSPGYQFRMDEGMRGVQNSAAAKGLLQSGGTLKGIMEYGQGVAAQDYNDQFNRQMAVAAGGQQANTTLGQLGASKANSVGDLLTGAGNAKASGYMGAANAWQNGINNANNQMMQAAMMASEPSLKINIVPTGTTIAGLPAYSYNYRQDADIELPKGRFVGVMADDVERHRPDALGPRIKGYRTVNYEVLAR